MAFDEKTWKEKIKERLKGWKGRMNKAGAESVYGFISGAALWPVIEAAKGGDLIAPMMELGKVLGGVGTNLLANLIQKWKDDGEEEATIAKQLAEKAARGKEGRIYPWGDDPDPDKANYTDTKIGTTSAVGCFPGGRSPYSNGSVHVEEMSGNVWEWTRSIYGEYPYPAEEEEKKARENLSAGPDESRSLRGGAFFYSDWGARCAFRDGYSPDYRFRDVGFRVIVSPIHL